MFNQSILVGRIIRDIENENETVTISIPRSHKNENGEYDTDFVDVVIKGIVAKITTEYCHKGDIIGIKGKVQTEIIEDVKKMIIVAERVTFLSSKKADK